MRKEGLHEPSTQNHAFRDLAKAKALLTAFSKALLQFPLALFIRGHRSRHIPSVSAQIRVH